jgi:FKBP-type peptidyl-prolyl cis-trans isomerase
MKRINETLANIGCGITDLPEPFQKRIESINKLGSQVEEARKEYETNPTEEEKEKLEDVFDYYENYILETCDMIETWDEDVKEKKAQKAKEDADAKADAEAKAKANAEAKAKEEAEKNQKPEPKKKGMGLGGIILGVAVLAITMGAVNTMRNK